MAKNLVIVESPAKAKTIEGFLGKEYMVKSSYGHVRDLNKNTLSVDIEHDFEPEYEISDDKRALVAELKKLSKASDTVWLASDEDREGESISWHLYEALDLKKKDTKRIVFHEITKTAILNAIENPRDIDMGLVAAQQARRVLDRLVGYELSPLLWKKVKPALSAGRVQSVAVRLIVEREEEIKNFVQTSAYRITAQFTFTKDGQEYTIAAELPNRFDTEEETRKFIESCINASYKVEGIEKKPATRFPAPPFTTSTLQQEASRKLGFSSKRTMATAQKLYESGFITYMRTDATNLSNEAVNEIREYIIQEYGDKFVPEKPNIYVTKSKNAQEAHEAIRPTHFLNTDVKLSGDELKLYNLIWKRTIACQMTNAQFDSVAVDIDIKNAVFHCVGTTRTFDGFMKVYIEDVDDEKESHEIKLPPLNINDKIEIKSLETDQHFTQPPARFTEASLVKKLEELGIGRPSTYATIMSTIVDRKYVEQDKQHRFHPTVSGWVLVSYLSKYFSDLVDVNFTAKTEDTLDDVSNGKRDKLSSLKSFWNPTNETIELARGIKTSDIIENINEFMHYHLFQENGDKCPKCGGKLGIKLSKFGPFIGCSNYPTCDYTMKLYDNAQTDESPDLQRTEQTNEKDLGENIFFKIGKYGPYVTNGVKNVSAKKYNIDTINLEIAKELLNDEKKKVEGVILGKNPATDKPIYYYSDGRYGPYISSNRVNVSVSEQPTLENAIDLINNKKTYKKTFVKKAK